MAEQNTPEKGALVTPATLKLQNAQGVKSPISGAPVTGDILRAAGTSAGPPNKQPANMSNQERALARMNGAMLNAYTPDTNKYNKITTYNATHHGRNFERYYAHPKFKELGFSPFRDNEAHYNKNSSLWDDAQRGIVTAGKLFGGAFVGSFKNWSNPFSMEPDTEASDEMERLMSVGSSSRGGFGSSVINFGVNSAYGFGVMGEVLAEEAVLAFGEAVSWGGLTPVVALRTAMNAKKLAGAFSLGRAAKSFSSAFKNVTKINEARQLWGVAKGIGKAADYLTPFSQTRSLLTTAGRAEAKWDSLDNLAKVSKGFGSFYRDLREINAVTYESKLEGGGVQTEVINNLMSDFRKKNGRDPNDQEAQLIYQQGHKAGYLNAQMNAVGIYVSNKIVLDKALKGIPGMAQADSVARRTMKGTLLKVQDWAKKGVNPWEVASGIKKYGKAAFYKQTFNPKNLAKGGLGYLSANLMEGTQEVYQEAIANGITSYYMDSFNNPSRVGGAEFQAKMLGGLKSQMSGQGMETFLSGFLMAGPMTAAQSAFFKGMDLTRRAKLKMQDKAFKADPANAGKASPFEEQLNAEKEYDQKVVDALNDMTMDPKKYFSAIEQNARTQADLERLGEQAAADGDMHAAKNIKDESLTNHIITMLESGHFEIFQDQLKGLKELDVQELQEAFDEPADAKKTVAQRIDAVLKRTEQIKETYNKYQEKANPFSMREDPLSYMAFEQARNIAIRNDVTYQRTGERMTDILNQFNSKMPFTNANATDFTNLFVVGGITADGMARVGLSSEIQLLDQQIQGLDPDIPEQKAEMDRLTEKRDNLKSLSGTLQAFASAYKTTQKAGQTEEEHATNMDTFVETEKTFRDAYATYVKGLAKTSGETVLDSSIDEGFQMLADFWKLNTDKQDVANAINMMQNPDMYRNAVERLRDAMDKAFAARKESLKKALDEYKKKHLVNAFFNDLFEKYNAFVEPEEAQGYVDKNIVPETFYDADTLEEIEPGSEKYKGIMALIDQYDEIYFEETGERLIRTELPENLERTAGYDTETKKAIAQEFQTKDEKDKRSIKELGKEFGFNHIDEESVVDAAEVLKAIARSKHGYVPRTQKKLAQALLGILKPGTQIRFKNGHRTNSTYDPTNGIIVDANYSAEGFTGANIPIEFSILNAVMQQIASESLSDMDFNDKITEIRIKFEQSLKDIDKPYFKYALANNQQFIAEAMTNADVQAQMEIVELEGELTEQTAEAKNLWESLMDSIYELLEKLFGVTRGKSLYQEAFNVITNKLSQPGVAGPSAVPSVVAEEEKEEEIDIEEDDPELDEMLRAKFNEITNAMPAADRVGMNFETWKQSDSIAISMRNKYNADKIKKAVATPGSATVMTEAEQVRRLTSLGYQIAEINNMKKSGQLDEIDNIIRNDIKKKIQIRTVDASGNVTYIEADYDQPIAAKPNVAAAIRKAVQTLEEANVDLTEDEKNYIQRVQVGIDPSTGEPIYKQKEGTPLYERLSSVVKDKFEGTTKEATDRGNIIDLLLRDFLKGDILDIRQFRNAYAKYQRKHSSAVFSEEMLNDLFDKFRSVQILLKSNGLTVISNLPGLYGKIGNRDTAGKIDLIAYDPSGKIYIIDLKTSTQDRRAQYKLETDLENEFGSRYPEIKEAIKGGKDRFKTISETINSTRISAEDKEKLRKVAEKNPTQDAVFFYKDQDARQQNGYRELLRQSTGLVADVLSIFPLLTSKTGKIFTKVEFQKEGKDHSMKVDVYDIHDKLGLKNEATYPENPIDRKAVTLVTPEPAATPTDIEAKRADIESAYSYITTRKYEGDRRDEVNKVGEDLAKRFVANLKEKGLVKEGFRTAERTDGSVEKVKVNTDIEGNNLGNDWSTAGKFKEEFRKFVDAELAALEGASTTADADRWYSPLVKMIAEQENISQEELDSIPGTGANGRVTKEDLMSFVSKRIAPQPKGRVKVKAFRTTGTFSSKVQYAQRGAGEYYALDKPFQDSAVPGEVTEVEVEYDTNKTLDATTVAGQQEFMAIKMGAISGKRFSSQDEMNEAVRTAMLEAGYESLIGRIDEDVPSAGKELVIYTRMPNQGSETRDKQEMEEEFEAPTPKEREPVREKTNHEINFETSPFQYRPTATTLGYWNNTEGRIVYFSKKTGEEILNANRLRKAAQKTFDPKNKKTHANFKFWWNNLLTDYQRNKINESLDDPLWYMIGSQDDMYSEEYQIMERLRGMKFKPTKFNKGEFKDVSDRVWFSENGAALDLFVLDSLIGDINTTFAEGSDEQDIQNMVIDIIKQYPNGITKADLKEKLRQDSLQVKFDELLDKYASQYGIDLNSLAELFDMYRSQLKSLEPIQDINEQEGSKNQGPSAGQAGTGQQRIVNQTSPRFQGKVIAVNFSSKTPLVREIQGVTYGTDIYTQVLSKFFSPELIEDMSKASISGENGLSNAIRNAAKLLNKAELTPEDVTIINSALGLSLYVKNKLTANGQFDIAPKHQQKILNNLIAAKEAIDNQVVKDARVIADNGGTVVFDNQALITHPGIDEVLISKSSDDYVNRKKESRENFDALIAQVDYQNITGKDLNDYLMGKESLEYYVDPKVANIRESIAKADRLSIMDIKTSVDSLKTLGVLEEVLKKQGLTAAEVDQLINDATARLKGTVAYKELTYRMMAGKPIEQRLIQYETSEGVKTGVLMAHSPEKGVSVAPYTGKESLLDLQDKSKWVTFTVSEIPYKLFDIKTTPTVTATPDITQQSDNLIQTAADKKTADINAFKDMINNDEFKNSSIDDAENDLFDGLQECPF